MTVTLATPPSASPIAEDLAAAMDWTYGPDDAYERPDAALAAAATTGAAVIVPPGVEVSEGAHCVAALHDGTPDATPAVEVAERAATALGAQMVVVHAAERHLHHDHGSLPAPRVADHDAYDWEEWRQEFVRRFCGAHPPEPLRLEVVTGRLPESLVNALGRDRVDLVVTTWKGDRSPGRAKVLKALAERSPAPVLVVLSPRADEAGNGPLGALAGAPG